MIDGAFPTSPISSGKSRRRTWMRNSALVLAAALLIVVGAFVAYVPHAVDNTALKGALAHVESGAIPDEPAAYTAQVSQDLADRPLRVLPGSYANLTTYNDVTYNAVLALKPDGTYDYALTVGNSRVYKLYKHSGRWWVEGRVLHTVLLDGDTVLTAPATRDKKTPSRERILEASADQLKLQAHYGQPVLFDKVK